MHLAYSALHHTGKRPNHQKAHARYRGYLAAYEKHRDTIAEIRQWLPGWEPEFLVGSEQLALGMSYIK